MAAGGALRAAIITLFILAISSTAAVAREYSEFSSAPAPAPMEAGSAVPVILSMGPQWRLESKCTARTSLIITIGPSPRHRAETASTILFGQRAMKVENMLKIKEEFDYRSLCRRLEIQIDKLIAENERQQKAFEDEVERTTMEAHKRISEAEMNYADALEREKMKCQMDYMESIKKLEEKWMRNQSKYGSSGFSNGSRGGKGDCHAYEDVAELQKMLQKEISLRKEAEEEIKNLRNSQHLWTEAGANVDVVKLKNLLDDETRNKRKLEEEVHLLQNRLSQLTFESGQDVIIDIVIWDLTYSVTFEGR